MFSTVKPAPFGAFTTPEFWDDDHISSQMLARHLDPNDPLASRRHDFIDESTEWLIGALHLAPRTRLLDLGCGPGLYAERFARKGVKVLGIDVSRRSLAYARATARREGYSAEFHQGDYLSADLGIEHDAAILIYEDYCALSPSQRDTLLRRIHSSLRPGGQLVFDVASQVRFSTISESHESAENLMDGFWSDQPYTGAHSTWTYPDIALVLDQYTIVTENSRKTFWNWMHCLSPEIVEREIALAGFQGFDLYADVTGKNYDPAGGTFAVITQRP